MSLLQIAFFFDDQHLGLIAVLAEDGDDEEKEKVEEEDEIYKLRTLRSLDTVIDLSPVAIMMIV